jgi:SOS-response transcriptional repressor LexA
MIASTLNGLAVLIPSMGLKERIREAMGKMSAADLARAAGVTPGAVTQWLDGTTKSLRAEKAARLEVATGYRAAWIVTGKGPKLVRQEESNVDFAPTKRRVPIISWVKAGSWSDVQDTFHPGEADEWADAFDSLPGSNAFALRVVGDSMTSPSPGARTFPEGTIIIVDPARGANAGDFVVAKDVHTQQATFKQLTTDGGRWFLRPLNPAYPTIEIDDPDMRVIGRVIEFQTRGKL